MKKILNSFASGLLISLGIFNVASCENSSSNNLVSIDAAINNELSKYNSNSSFMEIAPGQTKDWSQTVANGIYQDLVKNVSNFANYFTVSNIKIKVKQNLKYNQITQKWTPSIVDVAIGKAGIDNSGVYVGTSLIAKINSFVNTTYTAANPYVFNIGSLPLSNIFVQLYKSTSIQNNPKAKAWLSRETLDDVTSLLLDPTNPNSLSYSLPTSMPQRNSDGSPVTGAGTWNAWLTSVKNYFIKNAGYDITTLFNLMPSSEKMLSSDVSVWGILDSIAPDIINFHNYLKKNINSSTKFTFNAFFNNLLKYLFSVPFTPEGQQYPFSGLDWLDTTNAQGVNQGFANNLDYLMFDLFDNWYFPNKDQKTGVMVLPNYALRVDEHYQMQVIGSDGKSLTVDQKNNTNYDLRGIKLWYKFMSLPWAVTSSFLGLALNISGSLDFTLLFDNMFTKFFSQNYKVFSNVPIPLLNGGISIPFNLLFLHENEIESALSQILGSINVNTIIPVPDKGGSKDPNSQSKFDVFYKNSNNNWNALKKGYSGADFIKNIIESSSFSGVKIEISNLQINNMVTIRNGNSVSANKNHFAISVIF